MSWLQRHVIYWIAKLDYGSRIEYNIVERVNSKTTQCKIFIKLGINHGGGGLKIKTKNEISNNVIRYSQKYNMVERFEFTCYNVIIIIITRFTTEMKKKVTQNSYIWMTLFTEFGYNFFNGYMQRHE